MSTGTTPARGKDILNRLTEELISAQHRVEEIEAKLARIQKARSQK